LTRLVVSLPSRNDPIPRNNGVGGSSIRRTNASSSAASTSVDRDDRDGTMVGDFSRHVVVVVVVDFVVDFVVAALPVLGPNALQNGYGTPRRRGIRRRPSLAVAPPSMTSGGASSSS